MARWHRDEGDGWYPDRYAEILGFGIGVSFPDFRALGNEALYRLRRRPRPPTPEHRPWLIDDAVAQEIMAGVTRASLLLERTMPRRDPAGQITFRYTRGNTDDAAG